MQCIGKIIYAKRFHLETQVILTLSFSDPLVWYYGLKPPSNSIIHFLPFLGLFPKIKFASIQYHL
jgi:hypothetical protein